MRLRTKLSERLALWPKIGQLEKYKHLLGKYRLMIGMQRKWLVPVILLGCLSGCAFATAMTLVAAAPLHSELEMSGRLRYSQPIGKKQFRITPQGLKNCGLSWHAASKESVRCAKIIDGQKPQTNAADYPRVVRNVIARNPNMVLPAPSKHKTVLIRYETIEGTIEVFGAYFTYVPKTTVRAAFKSPP